MAEWDDLRDIRNIKFLCIGQILNCFTGIDQELQALVEYAENLHRSKFPVRFEGDESIVTFNYNDSNGGKIEGTFRQCLKGQGLITTLKSLWVQVLQQEALYQRTNGQQIGKRDFSPSTGSLEKRLAHLLDDARKAEGG
jgi:hypothetical protein